MVDTNKLRGVMAEKGITGKEMAKRLGITANTFSAKMKAGVFNSDEIEIIIAVLEIKNPMPIFFAKIVTPRVTNEGIKEVAP